MAAQVQTIKAGQLTKQQGRPLVGSIISPHRESVAETLTPQRLGQLMREADEGSPTAYLTLAEEMEEREPHYLSVLNTRKMAVSGTPAAVELPDDSADSKKIATHVEQRVVLTPVFEGLVLDLMDAVAKGFSCVEILWQRDAAEWWPKGYEFREQRHFVFDKDTMSIPLLRTDKIGEEQGEPLKPFQWIVHRPKLRSGVPVRTGLARTVAVCYAAKRWTVADWLAFLDVYGMPVRVGKYPTSQADKKKELMRAVQRIGSDAAAVIPQEMEIELLEAAASKGSGESLFRESAEYWDKQTSKVVVGQTMSSDDGSSLAQAKVHENVRFDIRDADSRAVSACIDEQLIKPFVDLNYGPQKVYPKCRIRQRKAEDLEPRMRATKIFVDLGGRVQASEVRDFLGWQEPEEGAELLKPAVKAMAGAAPGDQDDEDTDTDGDADAEGDPAKDGDEVEGDGKRSELNSERRRTYDATDEHVERELSDWRSLADDNVGRALQLVQNAESYEEARAMLEELVRDEGEVLDVEALVTSLAAALYKLRGIGDATDKVKP